MGAERYLCRCVGLHHNGYEDVEEHHEGNDEPGVEEDLPFERRITHTRPRWPLEAQSLLYLGSRLILMRVPIHSEIRLDLNLVVGPGVWREFLSSSLLWF